MPPAAPAVQPAAPSAPAVSADHGCPPGCEKCLKGGMPMKKELLSFLVLVLIGVSTVLGVLYVNEKRTNLNRPLSANPTEEKQPTFSAAVPAVKPIATVIALPKPSLKGKVSVEEALASRRSRREFAEEPVTLAELGQVLWSAQGITDDQGHRTAPSAHSLYPFTVYVVVRNVTGVPAGLYQYQPETHSLGSLNLANAGELLTVAGAQEGAQKAPVVLALAGAYGKMLKSFPTDPVGVTKLEGGHIGQNVYLQLEALNLGGVVMAGFDAAKVGQALKLDQAETIEYLIPFGHRAPVQPSAKPATSTVPAAKE